ncbi:MAG: CsgG/HfaB family protein [Leptospiraceae bacterium]|nr:CsgG/HfaB family protein [Leptospiraceae bacterium]
MKKSLFSVLLLLYSFCSTIDVTVTKNKAEVQKTKAVAVIPFDFKGKPSLGEEFATSLSIYLIKNGRVDVIERNKAEIERIMQEHKFSRSGLVDDKTAAELGKMIGVQCILIGYGDSKEVDGKTLINNFRMKLVNVETGNLVLGVIKDPGIEWTPYLIAKYTLGLFLIWDRNDMLIESSSVKHLADETAKSISKGLLLENETLTK